jgi:phosphoadenosine phosphosulfate reductase
MLIASPRHDPRDLERWAELERVDDVHSRSSRFVRHVARAVDALRWFVEDGPCYAGVSWGKDSTVLAHLVAKHAPRVPLVWVRVEPIVNPDCAIVRDAFLRAHDVDYYEIESWCRHDADGWHARGTLECGFAVAQARWTKRHLSGVRGEESGTRAMRMRRFGESTALTCAPIGWWSAADVYAYLFAHDLPVHPAYACSQGGLWSRDRIRVASLGGRRGDGMGRAEWEHRYYADALREIDCCPAR